MHGGADRWCGGDLALVDTGVVALRVEDLERPVLGVRRVNGREALVARVRVAPHREQVNVPVPHPGHLQHQTTQRPVVNFPPIYRRQAPTPTPTIKVSPGDFSNPPLPPPSSSSYVQYCPLYRSTVLNVKLFRRNFAPVISSLLSPRVDPFSCAFDVKIYLLLFLALS